MNWEKVTGSKDRHGSERDQRPAIDMDAKTGADFCLGGGGSIFLALDELTVIGGI